LEHVKKLRHDISIQGSSERSVFRDVIEDENGKLFVLGVLLDREKYMYEKWRGPVAFCHGDYHPMNIIWSADDIKCVIDWEFSEYKSEIYDAANIALTYKTLLYIFTL
jgi:aminoglycoside phosphotransferase (APT) family kinase protein